MSSYSIAEQLVLAACASTPAPKGGGKPTGALAESIEKSFGDYDKFKAEFAKAATGQFGSGWAWLMPDLTIETTANQDNPIMQGRSAPILGLDVWEHAYYLDYKASRADYVKAWWEVVDWERTAERFEQA